MDQEKEVIIVGGGLAGLSTAMRLAENGCKVKLFSVTKVKRSHSVCAQGGINGAMNLKGEDDSPFIHAYDTIKGGDFLADQPPVLEMCLAAPGIIRMMDRLGCPFNRTSEGTLDFRRFGGTLYHRTAFCGASTGQQLLYALDEQVRRYEVLGKIQKFENHEFMRLILDEKRCARGIVFMNLITMQFESVRGDAVVFATGGPGLIFKKSTNSTFCTGAANGRLFRQGMLYANGEFIQIHPTAIPGEDKLRLMSESLRGEGGRVWVMGDSSKSLTFPDGIERPCGKTGEPWYFLEEMYPGYGNLIARDVAAREILRVCELGMGVGGSEGVYLDMHHLPQETLHKVESVLEIYQKFTGEDPRKVPMKIYPAVHYSMGGAWVDFPAADDADRNQRFRQMTNITGCFAAGESEFEYHGANRLGANSLVACIFAGLTCGNEVPNYLETLQERAKDLSSKLYEEATFLEKQDQKRLLSYQGSENIHKLHDEMAEVMVRHMTVKRNNNDLQKAVGKLKEIRERVAFVTLDDQGSHLNQTLTFAQQFTPMLELSLAMTVSALSRNESRGAHFKPEYPNRDDENWLKTTLASYTKEEPTISYKPVDIRHLKPLARDYVHAKKVKPTLENIPSNIGLPV
ncbi:MAG: succinate dehydrogenase flavoprotein subunit [Candidatus Rhabdochlamydia sp.]